MSKTRRFAWVSRAMIPAFLFLACVLAQIACGGGGADVPDGLWSHRHKSGVPTHPRPGSDDPPCPAYDPSTPSAFLGTQAPATTVALGTIPGSFAVTGSGEATYTMPLTAPPGRAGVVPHLAITHGGSGDGVLGIGFSLAGLSAITRCPSNLAQDKQIRDVRYDEHDRFCIDGRRLVEIARPSGQIEYRTFPDAFTKVLAHLDATGTVPLSFEAFERSGLVIEYGGEDSGKPLAAGGVPQAWWATKVHDRRGNAMSYTYRLDAGNGYTSEHAIDEIRYTSFEGSAALAPSRAVKFVYGTKNAADQRTLYSRGMALRSTLRLDEIRMLGLSDQLVRRYHFTYGLGPTTNRTLLQQVEECAADGVCKPPTRFTFSSHPAGFKKVATNIPAPVSSKASPMLLDINRDGLDDLVLPDTDALLSTAVNPITNWNVALNRGLAPASAHTFATATSAIVQDWIMVDQPQDPGAGSATLQPELGTAIDYDQDGLTDIFLHDVYGANTHWQVLLARPGAAGKPFTFKQHDTGIPRPFGLGVIPPPPTLSDPTGSAHLADVDGDGVPDLIQCDDHSESAMGIPAQPAWTLHLWKPKHGNKPAGFEQTGTTIDGLAGYRCNTEMYTLDVNADGVVDLMVGTTYGLGGTMVPGATYSTLTRLHDGTWDVADTHLPIVGPGGRVLFLDVNGDGLPDAIESGYGDHVPRTFINTGDGFDTTPIQTLTSPGNGDLDTYFGLAVPIDYDADGRQDLLMPVPAGALAGESDVLPAWAVLVGSGTGAFTIVDAHIPVEAKFDMTGITLADPRGARVGDVNGDGAPDVVLVLNQVFNVFENLAANQDLLLSITDGMNSHDPGEPGFVPNVAITYDHLTDRSVTDGKSGTAREGYTYVSRFDDQNGCEYPLHCVVGPRRVVKSYALNNGADKQRRFALHYRDGRYHRLGRGDLGFSERIVEDLDTGATTADFYDNQTYDADLAAYPNAGQVVREWRWNPGLPTQPHPEQIELSFSDVELKLVPTNGSQTYFTLPTTRTIKREQGTYPPPWKTKPSMEFYVAHVAEKGGATRMSETVISVWDHDDFGNVLAENTFTSGVDLGINVKRTVKNDTSKWLLGQVKAQTECSTMVENTRCRSIVRQYNSLGEVSYEGTSSDDGNGETKLDVWYNRDVLGNVVKTSADDALGHHRSSCVTYEPEGIFPYASVNGAGHVSFSQFDPGLGVLVAAVDPNQLVMRWSHDGFGRLGQETRPDLTTTTYTLSTLKEGAVRHVALRATTDGGGDDTVEYDSLGRPIRSWWYGPQTPQTPNPACPACLPSPAPRVTSRIVFDDLGEHVARRSVPASESTPTSKLLYDEYAFDGAGRVVLHTTPWGATEETSYHGTSVEVVDPIGQPTFIEHDALGRVMAITDTAGGVTKYGYGHFATLKTVTDPGGASTVFNRDAFGRVVQLDDPNRGKTISHYNGFGELISTTDALGRVATFDYDMLGRTLTRVDQDKPDTFTTTWTWDTAPGGIGALAQVANADTVKSYTYETGRLKTVSLSLTGEPAPFVSVLDYDSYGRVQKITYPTPAGEAPFAVTHDHDAYGHVMAVREASTSAPYWQLTGVDAAGRYKSEAFGSGAVTLRSYFADKQRVKSIYTMGSSVFSPVQSLSYEYDPKLNLASRTDTLQAQHKTERFRHDTLNRLTCAYFGVKEDDSAACALAYDYELNGNLKSKTGIGILSYSDPKHPHAVTDAGSDTFTYDDVGNQTKRTGSTVTYTPFDLPSTISGGGPQASFAYDGDEQRVRKGVDGNETVYFGDLYERVTLANSGPMMAEHRYYVSSPERTIAIVTRAGATTSTRYLHTDNLGSVDAVTDEGGNVVERRSYDPFGAQRSPKWGDPAAPKAPTNTVGFTGHESDGELGLVNMKGRIFDPKVGRFLTPDPIVSRPGSGQSWNRYSYVMNNPLAYMDPSGFMPGAGDGTYTDDKGTTGPITESVVIVPKAPPAPAPPVASSSPLPSVGPPPPPPSSVQPPDVSQALAAGAARAPNDVGTTGNTSGYVPQPTTTSRLADTGIGLARGAWHLVSSLVTDPCPICRGYQEGGALGAANAVNPFYAVAISAIQVQEASDRGDAQGAAEASLNLAVGAVVIVVGVVELGGAGETAPKGQVAAGEAGAYGKLKGLIRDDLEAHHMPQKALRFTEPKEGGALVMRKVDHAQTRTGGGRGGATAQADAGRPFRDVLARDIRDVRRIVGSEHDAGLRGLLRYYYDNFPELIKKP